MRRNGRVVQGYPSINEAQEEHEDDEEEEEEDEAMSVSLSSERNRVVNLRDEGGKSLLSRPSQKTTGQSSGRSRKKIQEITLATLDPSNLSPRWVWSPLICLSEWLCGPVSPWIYVLRLFLSFFKLTLQTRDEMRSESICMTFDCLLDLVTRMENSDLFSCNVTCAGRCTVTWWI